VVVVLLVVADIVLALDNIALVDIVEDTAVDIDLALDNTVVVDIAEDTVLVELGIVPVEQDTVLAALDNTVAVVAAVLVHISFFSSQQGSP